MYVGISDQGKGIVKTTPRAGVRSMNQIIDTAVNTAKTFYEEVTSGVRQIPYALVEASTMSSSTSSSLTTTTVLPTVTTSVSTATPFISTSELTTTIATTISNHSAMTKSILNSFNTTVLEGKIMLVTF